MGANRTRDVLLAAAGRRLAQEEGGPEIVKLQPPVSAARRAEIERELGFAPPVELAELLELTAGIDLELDSLDLASIGEAPWPLPFGPVLTLAGDGAGNFWVIELRDAHARLGPVWFVCHDAPVLVWQSADLATFVEGWLQYQDFPIRGPLEDVLENAVQRVWLQTDPTGEELRDSAEPLLRDFARGLGPGWFVRDLRHAGTGDGMPIGRFGPRTPLARAGSEFVFAYGSRTRLERLKTWFTGR